MTYLAKSHRTNISFRKIIIYCIYLTRLLSSTCKKNSKTTNKNQPNKKPKHQPTKQPQSLSQEGFTLLLLSPEINESPKQAIGLGWSTLLSSYWLQSTVWFWKQAYQFRILSPNLLSYLSIVKIITFNDFSFNGQELYSLAASIKFQLRKYKTESLWKEIICFVHFLCSM